MFINLLSRTVYSSAITAINYTQYSLVFDQFISQRENIYKK